MLTPVVCEFTLPTNSSMIFGGSPVAGITVGAEINFAMVGNYSQNRRRAIDFFSSSALDSPDNVGLA
jgi:hypothetical protein